MEKKKETKSYFDLLQLNIGFYLIIPLLLGVFIGYSFDRWLQTKPLFLLVFLGLGTIGAFYNLWKLMKSAK